MSKENLKFIEGIEYALIVALYYVAGGAFSYTNYSFQITSFFLISLGLLIAFGRQWLLLCKMPFMALLLMFFFIILVPLINDDSISSYLANIMQISIGFFCASIIPIERFKMKFVDIMVFFAAVSLVGFAVGAVYPSIAQKFPLTIGDASVDYYNAGIYVFMRPKGYGSFFLTKRNAGICWEPGCYQCFLNIAILMLLEKQDKKGDRHFYTKFAILIMTVITTISTTGIIILTILLVVYAKTWLGETKETQVFAMTIAIAAAGYFFFRSSFGKEIIDKITREFTFNNSGEGQNVFNRTSLGHMKYLFEGGFWFFGMSFSRWLTVDAPSLWNSIIHSALCMGIPFTCIHLMGYWYGSHRVADKGWLLFLMMIMCASTETLFWRVFFNTVAAYGWIYYELPEYMGELS